MSPTEKTEEELSYLQVLLVDDDRFARTLIKTALSQLGIRYVTEAKSAVEAIELLKTQPVDVALVDHEMPGVTGLELVRLIRNGKEGITNTDVPVVMITGNTDKSTVVGARDVGIQEYVVKPISPAALEKRLAKAVSMVRQERAKEAVNRREQRKKAEETGEGSEDIGDEDES